MDSLRCLSIIMPVYNEVKTLREVVRCVHESPLPKELIIVDDGSTDGSREILKELESNKANKIIYHEKNKGKGASLLTGIQAATGDLLIIQDADLEYNPLEYPKLVGPILQGTADVVYGSRFQLQTKWTHFSFHTMGNKILTTLSNIFTGLHLTDMETCYKVFKTDLIKDIPIRSPRFGFEPEVTAKVAKRRCRVIEIPISYNGRSYAEGKKITWKDGISAIVCILKYWVMNDTTYGKSRTN